MKLTQIILVILSVFIFNLKDITAKNNDNLLNDYIYWGFFLDEIFISNGIYSVALNPFFGYRINERFLAGPVFKYHFYKTNEFSAHDYGLGLLADFTFIKEIHHKFPFAVFSQFSYEYYNMDKYNQYKRREWIDMMWLGAGLRQYFGENNSAGFVVSWNVFKGSRMPKNPAFRFFFVF